MVRGVDPGGGGGQGDMSPTTFFQVGDTISNVDVPSYIKCPPPPPPRFGGRMKIYIINVPFCVIYLFCAFFPFFLLVNFFSDVGKVPLQILTCATFDADGAPKKSVVSISFFGTCVTFGSDGGGKICMSPLQSASDLRPCMNYVPN